MKFLRFIAVAMLMSSATVYLSAQAAEEGNLEVVVSKPETSTVVNVEPTVEDVITTPVEVPSSAVVPTKQSIGEKLGNIVTAEQREFFVHNMQKFGESFTEFVSNHPMLALVTGIALAKKVTGGETKSGSDSLLIKAAIYDLLLAITRVPPLTSLSFFVPACFIIDSL